MASPGASPRLHGRFPLPKREADYRDRRSAPHAIDAEYDRRRTEELERIGFEVLRFTNDEIIGDIDRVLERIAATALKGPTAGPSPLPLSHSGEGFPSERDS